jgi:acyl-CoA reductase-like NAD-dependent aldehyde dehydrogenase
VLSYIESGKEQGARVVTGGRKWPESNGGYWIEPTILADTNPDMKVVQEEVSTASVPEMVGSRLTTTRYSVLS